MSAKSSTKKQQTLQFSTTARAFDRTVARPAPYVLASATPASSKRLPWEDFDQDSGELTPGELALRVEPPEGYDVAKYQPAFDPATGVTSRIILAAPVLGALLSCYKCVKMTHRRVWELCEPCAKAVKEANANWVAVDYRINC